MHERIGDNHQILNILKINNDDNYSNHPLINFLKQNINLELLYFSDIYEMVFNESFDDLINKLCLSNYTQDCPNVEIGTDFLMFKSPNKNIYCINKKTVFIDIKTLHMYYCKYMKVSFRSFSDNSLSDNSLFDNSFSDNLLYKKIITNTQNVLIQIINYITDIDISCKTLDRKSVV